MNNIINFSFGTLEKYNAIITKDNDTLYFADGQIFKGDTRVKATEKALTWVEIA